MTAGKICEMLILAVFLRCDGFIDGFSDVSVRCVSHVPQDSDGRPVALCKCPCQNTIDRMKEELKSAGGDPDVLEDRPSNTESCCEEETGQNLACNHISIEHVQI